jgi:hypothetical protein
MTLSCGFSPSKRTREISLAGIVTSGLFRTFKVNSVRVELLISPRSGAPALFLSTVSSARMLLTAKQIRTVATPERWMVRIDEQRQIMAF